MVLLLAMPLMAQQVITGKVTDDKNSPLPGVSIQVKNTLRGAYSDIDGNFSISASQADTLIFSMIGMVTQSILVGNQATINVKMLTEETSCRK